MLSRIMRKAASVARNRWADYTRRDRLFTEGKRLLWTGPEIDRLLDYMHAWKNLQYRPHLRSPRTLNEFILASKYDFQGDMALARRIADKVEFKAWLNETPARRPLVVPTLAVFDTPQELHGRVFDADMILKPTHISGNVILIDRRRQLTDDELRQVERWHRRDYYKLSREPVYKGLAPRIICEPLLRDQDGLPARDFKFLMIGGRPLMIQLDQDRHTGHNRQLYSPDWKLQEFEWVYPRPADSFPRPIQLDAALKAASDLAHLFPLCRVDLYLLPDGAIKAGEVTFFPDGGKGRFNPVEGDFELGRKAKVLMSGSLMPERISEG
ncbi:MAG: ATP-grasp fold amidoligase family protein [Rhodospirillaceae bacterium]|nr:ATP-grasp fold amidoligase family protein [Rhodospirillaceae bacterium]